MCAFSELQAEFDARKDQRDFAKHQQDIVFGTCDPKALEVIERTCHDWGLFSKVTQTGRSIQIKLWENPSDPCMDVEHWSCVLIEACMSMASQSSPLNFTWPEVFHFEKGHAVLLIETY